MEARPENFVPNSEQESGVIRKEVSFIAQKDSTLSSKLSELYGSWLVKFKTP